MPYDANDVYTDLDSGTLKVTLSDDTIDNLLDKLIDKAEPGTTYEDTLGYNIFLIDEIKAKTDNLKDSWNDITAANVWGYTTRTLTSLGTSVLSAIWNFATGSVTGGIGKQLKDNVDEKVSTVDGVADSIKAQTDKLDFDASNYLKTNPQVSVSLAAADQAAIVDAIFDETLSDHVTVGSVGEALRYMRGNAVGKWKVENATSSSFQLKMYDSDNATLLATFDVSLDADGKPEERST